MKIKRNLTWWSTLLILLLGWCWFWNEERNEKVESKLLCKQIFKKGLHDVDEVFEVGVVTVYDAERM